ncbi:MAM and LDL-receptor class A domain-containing protein 1-like [Saccostrea cucullata]|uniref:MAM and LDL-receptor class A domain-containing protein 1-like n=1 Tax=Saccostrea cuccullata TaxID=36930 RepID=UPI002ED4E8EF
MYCGGKDNVNIYSVAQDLSLDSKSLINPDYSLCVSYQCIDNSYIFKERNCGDPSINDVACNDYFSCTFEPEDLCFLVQYKNKSFDWTVDKITERNGPEQAYEGSYFAYVDDTSYSYGNSSLLGSNTLFQAKKWCLRFRYFSYSADSTAALTVVTYNNVTKEVKFHVTITRSDFEEWKYAEQNIQIENGFVVGFLATRGNQRSIFAIDDVTMIAGTCEESVTKLLHMKGKMICNFEGGVDTCFNQDTKDDFNWTITREGKTDTSGTGPSSNIDGNYFSYIEANGPRRNEVARIVSKFYLENVNIELSMWYHMYGRYVKTLKVFLRNQTQGEQTVFERSGNRGNFWVLINRTLTIEGKWQLCIEANVPTSNTADIAIDDIRIKIIQNGFNKTWMNFNERCIRNLGSYSRSNILTNAACISNDHERWTGIVRTQRKGSDQKVLKGSPNAVRTFEHRFGMYSYVWETFSENATRTFVCEKRLNASEDFDQCLAFSEVSEDFSNLNRNENKNNDALALILVVVISFAFVVSICILVIIILCKRKLAMKAKYEKQHNSSTKEQVNFMYMNSDDILIIQNKTSSMNSIALHKQQIPSESGKTGGVDSNEIYVNQEPFRPRAKSTKNINDKDEIPEEDYDHLNRNNNVVTTVQEDTYSHMTDGQYGTQQIQCEDTYDHTGGTEGEYGAAQIDQDVNNMYDHTVLNDTDDVYSLPNKGSCQTETVYNIVVKKTCGTD